MTKRLQIGDVIAFRGHEDASDQFGTVIGHPSYAPEHDVVVIAPYPPQGHAWRVLNDDWCNGPHGQDVRRARRERYRLRQGAPRGFLERPRRGWSRR